MRGSAVVLKDEPFITILRTNMSMRETGAAQVSWRRSGSRCAWLALGLPFKRTGWDVTGGASFGAVPGQLQIGHGGELRSSWLENWVRGGTCRARGELRETHPICGSCILTHAAASGCHTELVPLKSGPLQANVWLAGCLLACVLALLLACSLDGWLVGWLAGWLAGWLVGCLVGWLVRWFVGSLFRWFVGSSVRWSVGSLVRLFASWTTAWFVFAWLLGS